MRNLKVRDDEYGPYSFDELTASEQREVIERGFPRETGVRYLIKSGARSLNSGLHLSRFARL